MNCFQEIKFASGQHRGGLRDLDIAFGGVAIYALSSIFVTPITFTLTVSFSFQRFLFLFQLVIAAHS